MPCASLSHGVDLEFDTFGNPENPAMLWIMGFTAQMIAWPEEFLQKYADEGFFVIRFDNRDCGLSSKFDGVAVDTDAVVAAALMDTDMPEVPYTLRDMAADAVGLLDHLRIDRAHIIGASMGGMIAQVLTIEHPHRVLTLTSIMSVSGDPAYGQSQPEALEALLAPPPANREDYIEGSKRWLVWQSKKYGDVQVNRERAAREYDRMFYPEGASRQLAAIYASGRRNEQLMNIQVPTLVIHGLDDTLLDVSGGKHTAELIPNSRLLLVDDMGHDVPEPLWPMVVDEITKHARQV
jgi:pimeloyl-ACP methyl ester carboxylesterase